MAIAVVEATREAFFKKVRRLFSGMPELYLAGSGNAALRLFRSVAARAISWVHATSSMGFLPRGEIMRRFSFNLLKNSLTTCSLAAAKPAGHFFCPVSRLAACALLTGFLIALLPATSTVFAANTPAHPAASAQPNDSQISTTIRTKLAKSKIGAEGFKFRVEKGVGTWEGHTEVPEHKGAATRRARAAGAAQVINNIEVGAAGKAKASAQLHPATVASQ